MKIRTEQPKIGTRKIYHLIQVPMMEHRIKIGRDALFNLLSKHHLLVRKRKRKTFNTNTGAPIKIFPNLIKDLIIDAPNMLWVCDITYVKTAQSFIYLFLITDAYSKKILGYCLSNNLSAVNAGEALKMALKQEKNRFELIHHSDRGLQYGCANYVNLLRKNGIQVSMTKGGSPHENAIAERINGIIKNELLAKVELKGLADGKKEIRKAINVYNEKRPHLSCSMLTPSQAHSANRSSLKHLWKNYKKQKSNLAL